MKLHITCLSKNLSIKNLFTKPPVLYFKESKSFCDCGGKLKVLKTHSRTVFTLRIGKFDAHETILQCDNCKRCYASRELKKLVPEGSNFGFDVTAHVGKATFLDRQADEEILRGLLSENITISFSEIAYLQKKFIVYLARAHNESSQKIREAMDSRGGYILHLDGTCDGDSPHLMTGLDEISGFVLQNVKISSEKAEKIIPLLKKIKEKYGTPVAIVSDMGKGIVKAVKKVFPDVLHLVCHFHFLRDIGKDLLDKEYEKIRKRLRQYKITSKLRKRAQTLKRIIESNPELVDSFYSDVENGHLSNSAPEYAPVVSTYSLICWALDGKRQGKGYGFPFDRPYITFYQRLRLLYDHLERLGDIQLRGEWRDNRPFFRTRLDMKEVINSTALRHTLTDLESRIEVFDKLRDAMQITTECQHQGLNDDGEDVNSGTIRKRVEAFCDWLMNDARYSSKNDYGKLIAQINKYWENLFADPITNDTPRGKVTFLPQRTNNILERFFRDIKRDHRRKTGTNSMKKKLKAMLADMPLVKNLEIKEYVDIILDNKATLAERFSEIDANIVREQLKKSQENSEAIPVKLRKIIKQSDLPQIVMKLFILGNAA